ncbi:hypothetical protein LUZ60_015469 [Juncus effusus]|nr:hypothetical protein LUZ60_015469 [Juncus effusus]
MPFVLLAKGIFVQESYINTHVRTSSFFHQEAKPNTSPLLFSFLFSFPPTRRHKITKILSQMTKVHPNSASLQLHLPQLSTQESRREEPEVLTVWRKSLLFNTNGFTVFDAKGNLVFRVDNYGSGCKNEVVLMDATGRAVLTVRRKKQLNLGDHWVIYKGEDSCHPIISVKRHTTLRHVKSLAHVTPFSASTSSNDSNPSFYVIEGSYLQRSCVLNNREGRQVGEICRKDTGGVSFGDDVFRLVVGPQLSTSIAMGIVIALDQMASSRPYLIRSWSS